jgi:hypothetical protein
MKFEIHFEFRVSLRKFQDLNFWDATEYCEGIDTQLCFASVAHPRSNSQVERAEILRGLKTRTYDCLKKHGANWVNELPSVLWGNRTTPSRAIRETRSS